MHIGFSQPLPLGNRQCSDTLLGRGNIHRHRKAHSGSKYREHIGKEFVVAIGGLDKNLALVFTQSPTLKHFQGLPPLLPWQASACSAAVCTAALLPLCGPDGWFSGVVLVSVSYSIPPCG